MSLIGIGIAHLGKNVSEYELVQPFENATRDTLNAIGAAAVAESALNAQRHKKLLESGAVVAAQILDVEGAALGAASTATQAPAALRCLLERLPEASRAARSDDAQRQLAHDDPTPGVVTVTVTSGVETVRELTLRTVESLKEKVARMRAARELEERAESRRLNFDDTALGAVTGVETVSAATGVETVSTNEPPSAVAGASSAVRVLPRAAAEPPSAAGPSKDADASSSAPRLPAATADERDEPMGDAVGSDKTPLSSDPKRARTSPPASLDSEDTEIR